MKHRKHFFESVLMMLVAIFAILSGPIIEGIICFFLMKKHDTPDMRLIIALVWLALLMLWIYFLAQFNLAIIEVHDPEKRKTARKALKIAGLCWLIATAILTVITATIN